jgi:isoleucyl-tRNA synthetase
MFEPVDPQPNFPELEKRHLKRWYEDGIVDAYLHKNDASDTRFSFLDGPITANNPMGVHHAWGRSYKDLWQRFHNLLGHKQRFHDGFDCQGLWVEVEVEKELGIRNKKEIENLVDGDRFASIAKFVQLCKDRVYKFSAIQTEQTKRLGNFMDWDNPYYTMSDENNYMIWHFLKRCFEHGWTHKGHDTVPWCPRCETAISQHEMLTEDYKEATHESIFVKFPITTPGWENTSLLVWTTTPWSVPADVAVGINISYTYGIWESEAGDRVVMLHKDGGGNTPERHQKKQKMPIDKYVFYGLDQSFALIKDVSGSELLGLAYATPFDDLQRVKEARQDKPELLHTVVDASDLVNAEEGTGLLHVATAAGTDDFILGKKLGLPVIEVLKDDASYLDGMGEFSDKNAKKHPELIIDYLQESGALLKSLQYTHRYPACWRCKAELVWKVTDEWYIGMDVVSTITKKTFREMMIDNAQKIHWMPEFGLDRELDWLNHLSDWLISKKNRYWGLALPIYECSACGNFEVLGGKSELQERAVEGWKEFDGHSPHKPYIDLVKIACPKCGELVERIGDVGNVWLDAGIVPFSTISADNKSEPLYVSNKDEWTKWFPADFITESFPGQFKNWFYALIAMSTALENEAPFKSVLGYGTLLAEDGRPMHKSWGNSIDFNEGADKIGADVMRWMYARTNPSENMLFGYKIGDEVRRSFLLMLWNIYRFFVDYARLDGFDVKGLPKRPSTHAALDEWIIHRLHLVIRESEKALLAYDARSVTMLVEDLIRDISTWYIRRSRDRVWIGAGDTEDKKIFYQTLHYVLVNLMVVISPITPYISDEIYQNLTGEKSVHLASWPQITEEVDTKMLEDMENVRKIAEIGNRLRREASLKVKQPLQSMNIEYPHEWKIRNDSLWQLVQQELNVKNISARGVEGIDEPQVELDTNITPELKDEGDAREIVRTVQQERQKLGLKQGDKISLTLPDYPASQESYIKQRVLAESLIRGDALKIEKLSS